MLRTPAPAESQTVASAGRTVAFGVYGHSSGAPVVLFPGTPGSRFAGRMCQDWAEDAGCRLIVPDRPGFGGSPFQPGRRLVDHAGDVAAICEHLGIKQFAALGISGGTPFVLACASLMPERVTAGAIVSGFFGLDTLVDPSAYAEEQRTHLEEVRKNPETTRASYDQAREMLSILDPMEMVRQQVADSPDWIKLSVDEDSSFAQASHEYLVEALRQGADGAVQEMALATQPWGIDLARVAAEIRFWHGGKDQNPRVHVEAYIRALPHASISWHEDLGHFDCVFLLPEVFAWLTEKHGGAATKPQAGAAEPN